MSASAAYDSNLRRGQLLRESARFEEACRFFGDAIQADPEQPQAYLELALAQSQLPARRSQALATVDRAVSLAPTSAHYLGYKAYLQSQLGLHLDALTTASHALEIDPSRHIALLARANAYTKLGQWEKADTTAVRMLQLDPLDTAALNLHAQALRFQKRYRESREVIAQILSRVPEDPFAQANAGWDAINSNDYRRANNHFLNALRIDPHYDYARRGLLQSLRSRSLVYRINFKIMELITPASDRLGKVFALFVLLSGGLLLGPLLLYVAVGLTLLPVSNFFLLFDPKGRHALKPRDRRWAIFTGIVACLLLLTLALAGWTLLFFIVWTYLSLFAISVYLPQWADAWHARREEKSLAMERPAGGT